MTQPKFEHKANFKLETLRLTDMLEKTLKELNATRSAEETARLQADQCRQQIREKDIKIKLLENQLSMEAYERSKTENQYTELYNRLNELERQFDDNNYKSESRVKSIIAQTSPQMVRYQEENRTLNTINQQLREEVERLKLDNQNIVLKCQYDYSIQLNKLTNEWQHRGNNFEHELGQQKEKVKELEDSCRKYEKIIKDYRLKEENQFLQSESIELEFKKQLSNEILLRQSIQSQFEQMKLTTVSKQHYKNAVERYQLISEQKDDKISDLKQQIQQLQRQMQSCTKQNQQKQDQIAIKLQQSQALRMQKEQYQIIIQNLKTQKSKLLSEKDTIFQQLQHMQAVNHQSQAKLCTFENSRNQLQSRLHEITLQHRSQIDRVQTQQKEQKHNLEANINNLEQQNGSLKQAIQELKQKYDKVNHENAFFSKEIQTYIQRDKQHASKITQLTAKCSKLLQENNNLKADESTYNDNILHLNKTILQLETQVKQEKTLRTLETERVIKLNKSIIEVENTVKHTQSAKKQMKDSCRNLEEELENQKIKYEELKKQKQSRHTAHDKIVRNLYKEIEALRQQKELLTLQIEQNHKAFVDSSVQYKSEMHELQKVIKKKEQELASIRTQLDLVTHQMENQKKLRLDDSRRRDNNKLIELENIKLQEKVQYITMEKSNELLYVREQLRKSEKQVQRYQNIANLKASQYTKLDENFKKEISRFTENLEEMKRQKQQYKFSFEQLTVKYNKIFKQLESLHEECILHREQLKNDQDKIIELNSRMRCLEDQITQQQECSIRYQRVSKQYQNTLNELNTKDQELELFKSKFCALEADCKKLRNEKIMQKNSNQEKLKTQNISIHRYIEQIKILQEKYDSKTRENETMQNQMIQRINTLTSNIKQDKQKHEAEIRLLKQSKIGMYQSSEQKIKNELKALREENTNIKKVNHNLRIEAQVNLAKLKEVQDKLSLAEAINKTYEKEMHEFYEQSSDYKKKCESDLSSAKLKIKELQKQNLSLKVSLRETQGELHRQRQTVREIEDQKQMFVESAKENVLNEKNREIKKILAQHQKRESHLLSVVEKKKQEINELKQKSKNQLQKYRISHQTARYLEAQHKDTIQKLDHYEKQLRNREEQLRQLTDHKDQKFLVLESENKRLINQLQRNRMEISQTKTSRDYENTGITSLRNTITRLRQQIEIRQKNEQKINDERKAVKEQIFFLKRELENIKDDLIFERKRNSHLEQLYQKYRNVKNLTNLMNSDNETLDLSKVNSQSKHRLYSSTESPQTLRLKPTRYD